MTTDQLITWATIIMSAGGAVGVVVGIIRPLVKNTKKLINSLSRFTDDWFGEEAAPGRDAVPGVMERLNNIDGELKHNGGSTMKDSMKRIEQSLEKIQDRLKEGEERFENLEARTAELEKKDD